VRTILDKDVHLDRGSRKIDRALNVAPAKFASDFDNTTFSACQSSGPVTAAVAGSCSPARVGRRGSGSLCMMRDAPGAASRRASVGMLRAPGDKSVGCREPTAEPRREIGERTSVP
jgi:hypothetical protein